MATFTTRLKDAFLMTGGSWDSSSGISVLTGGDIGLSNYPLFTDNQDVYPDYRPTLNGKIFDHFMNREIGQESIGMFQLAMRRCMNEIMPYYNQLYLSTKISITPISTIDIETENTNNDTQTTEGNASSTGATTSTSGARAVSSETPQTMLQGDEDYATSATDTNSQGANNSTGSQSNNSTVTDAATGSTTVSGYQGSPADLLMRYRDSFINVDTAVIDSIEREGLFMLLWDNGDEYFHHGIGQLSAFYGEY